MKRKHCCSGKYVYFVLAAIQINNKIQRHKGYAPPIRDSEKELFLVGGFLCKKENNFSSRKGTNSKGFPVCKHAEECHRQCCDVQSNSDKELDTYRYMTCLLRTAKDVNLSQADTIQTLLP